MNTNFWIAIFLTLFAGLSTGLGGLFVFLYKKTNTKLLSIMLGFSAGVMIYVSFVEIFPEANAYLVSAKGEVMGSWIAVAALFGGMLIIAIIDKIIPTFGNPHEVRKIEDMGTCNREKCNRKPCSRKLLKSGLVTAIAVTVHNFPEGIAAFTSAIKQPSLGITIALAIAIHNIPEGIAVSFPIYCATGSRRKALWLSILSGLSEPLGAIIGYLILYPFMTDTVFGVLFAGVAGIMVFISLDELLPTAEEYGEHHLAIYGLIGGMAFMALSLLLFL